MQYVSVHVGCLKNTGGIKSVPGCYNDNKNHQYASQPKGSIRAFELLLLFGNLILTVNTLFLFGFYSSLQNIDSFFVLV